MKDFSWGWYFAGMAIAIVGVKLFGMWFGLPLALGLIALVLVLGK